MIDPGDLVVATRDGGHDKDGFPRERPLKGRTYRVTSIYPMKYGLGCTLEGMSPAPYKGYFLYVAGSAKAAGWYFKKFEGADDEFIETMRQLKEKMNVSA